MFSNIIFLILRIVLGSVFLVSGFEKVTNPYQNFLYVLQVYDVVPQFLETYVAIAFPWIELIVGIFVVLGLWLRQSLAAAAVMLCVFISVITQALLRGLDLSECGCFGSLIQIPPQGTLIMDCVLLLLAIFFLKQIKRISWFSLDRYC